MKRKYLDQLVEWDRNPNRKPLMIWGARQVGKSYLAEELFAKVYYKDAYLKIDLSDEDDFVSFAEQNSNLEKALVSPTFSAKTVTSHSYFIDNKYYKSLRPNITNSLAFII